MRPDASVDFVDLADTSSPAGTGRSIAMLSTYPPTPCGIATFAAALGEGLVTHDARVGVVRLGRTPAASNRAHNHRSEVATDGPHAAPGANPHPDRVVVEIDELDPTPSRAGMEAMNSADIAIVQHEYGLYAGPDGDAVVGMLEALRVPSIVVAHTVLGDPTPHQRSVLEDVVAASDAVVVMTEAGRVRLCAGFDVDASKVSVIPHGAAVAPHRADRHAPGSHEVLTWGLLGPGKGIEWMIDALGLLGEVAPRVQYRIAGDTHPKVLAAEGESYRRMLERRSWATGVAPSVTFDVGYRDLGALADLISAASVVVLPYDSPDQVTSGVLVDAVAAGRPVVATAFPHAVELLGSGAGLVVPRRDPVALADAVRRVLTEPGLAEAMAAEARRIAPSLAWTAIADRYRQLGEALLARRAVPA